MITQERAKNLEAQVKAQAERIKEQSAALKLARDALENHQGNYVLSKKECQPINEALAAIDEVLKGE